MPRPVVSNSSPIIHLAKIGRLDLLQDFFGELLIPEAVYEECITEGRDRSEVPIIKQASWLRVVPVTNQNLVSLLKAEIDRGEAESIALALETQASLILLDDYDAREKARLYHLKITGILGLLIRAKRSGKLTS
jgi:predicted nucleic acid-binding protein